MISNILILSTLIIFTVTKSFDESTEQRELMIELMYNTAQDHSCGWHNATTTALFCKINSEDDPIIIQNDLCGQGNKHAEELLIEKLNSMDKSLLTKITIYINNLPCHYCTKQLIKFLKENPTVILILYVANLYNIRRSCSNESHYLHVSENDHQVKMELKTLMTHERCVVSAFSCAVWSELLNIASVSKIFQDPLLEGYRTKLNLNDRRRADKDIDIRNELYKIRHLPLYVINKFL